jgi:hypothetical protein
MLKNSVFIIIITIVLALSVELVMHGIYLVTGSRYAASSIEDQRRLNGKLIDCHNDSKQHVKKTKKIAIFGGSSSAGFASPVRFTDLLCDSDFNNNHDLEITNYAVNGESLAGFQAEVIKSVMKYFDVIIIYSGHNEYINQLYLRDALTVFPNGILFVEHPKLVHKKRLRELSNIKNRFSPNYPLSYLAIVDNSRIYHFTSRVIGKLTLYAKTKFKPSEKETIYPKDFYYKDYFVSPNERKNIINLYRENIIEISKKLRKDQKLIISTVLSNDMFPPIADVFPASHDNQLDDLNDELMQTYDALSKNEYKQVRESINTLPKSAHRFYIEGILCLRTGVTLISRMPKDCLAKFKKARDLDGFPARVLSEINSFIRQFNHGNVVVVDPVASMLNRVENFEEYMKYFVDFQHPSNLGHAIIAENILIGLYGSNATSRSYNVRTCGIDWKGNGGLKSWSVDHRKCAIYLKDNIRWLDTFMKVQPIPYQYDYYKSISERALMDLEGKD